MKNDGKRTGKFGINISNIENSNIKYLPLLYFSVFWVDWGKVVGIDNWQF
jgi:hypothetical protein